MKTYVVEDSTGTRYTVEADGLCTQGDMALLYTLDLGKFEPRVYVAAFYTPRVAREAQWLQKK